MREAITNKIPYAVVIGDSEYEKRMMTVRNRNLATQEIMEVEEFVKKYPAFLKAGYYIYSIFIIKILSFLLYII